MRLKSETEQNEIRELTHTELETIAGGLGQIVDILHANEAGSSATDKASPGLMSHCVTGRHVGAGKITC